MTKPLMAILLAFALLAAACGDDNEVDATADEEGETAEEDPAAADEEEMTEEEMAEEEEMTEEEMAEEEPVTGPASITADDQTGDGSTVTVASVALPTDGFVVVHADAEGAAGPILGWSDLIPAGDSTDVVVTLTEPLDADATVWPMAHVDANGNGVYEFMPPDVVDDVPATTADGAVAVLSIAYTIG